MSDPKKPRGLINRAQVKRIFRDASAEWMSGRVRLPAGLITYLEAGVKKAVIASAMEGKAK